MMKLRVITFKIIIFFIVSIFFISPIIRQSVFVLAAPAAPALTRGGVMLLERLLMTAGVSSAFFLGIKEIFEQESLYDSRTRSVTNFLNQYAEKNTGIVHDSNYYVVTDAAGNAIEGTMIPKADYDEFLEVLKKNVSLNDMIDIASQSGFTSNPTIFDNPVFNLDAFLRSLGLPIQLDYVGNAYVSHNLPIIEAENLAPAFIYGFQGLSKSVSITGAYGQVNDFSLNYVIDSKGNVEIYAITPSGSKFQTRNNLNYFAFADGLSVALRTVSNTAYVDVFYVYAHVGDVLWNTSRPIYSARQLVGSVPVSGSVVVDYSSIGVAVPNVWQNGVDVVADSTAAIAGYPNLQDEGIIIWNPANPSDIYNPDVTIKDVVIPGAGVSTDVLNPPIPKPTVMPTTAPSTNVITGQLDSILDLLLNLPSAIAAAIVGDMILDFSKLNNPVLTTVFPFCIPFDFNALMRIFDVTPKPPVFSVNFAGTVLGSNSFTFDMSKFSELVLIFRHMMMAIFVYGLIVSTYKFIKW